jgi:hypothetical protein
MTNLQLAPSDYPRHLNGAADEKLVDDDQAVGNKYHMARRGPEGAGRNLLATHEIISLGISTLLASRSKMASRVEKLHWAVGPCFFGLFSLRGFTFLHVYSYVNITKLTTLFPLSCALPDRDAPAPRFSTGRYGQFAVSIFPTKSSAGQQWRVAEVRHASRCN